MLLFTKTYRAKAKYCIRDLLRYFYSIFFSLSIPGREFVVPIVDVCWMEFWTRFRYTRRFDYFMSISKTFLVKIKSNSSIGTHFNKKKTYMYISLYKRAIEGCWHSIFLSCHLMLVVLCVCVQSATLLLKILLHSILFIIYLVRVDRHFVMIYTRHFCAMWKY